LYLIVGERIWLSLPGISGTKGFRGGFRRFWLEDVVFHFQGYKMFFENEVRGKGCGKWVWRLYWKYFGERGGRGPKGIVTNLKDTYFAFMSGENGGRSPKGIVTL
jgi:hypothetical protein